MYFQNPEFIVKYRSDTGLKFETNSGRSFIVPAFCIALFFFPDYIRYPGMTICLLAWTYREDWIVDKAAGKLKCERTIAWMSYEAKVYSLNIRELRIEKRWGGGGHVGYSLIIIQDDGNAFSFANRSDCRLLRKIAMNLRPYLPPSTRYKIPLPRFRHE